MSANVSVNQEIEKPEEQQVTKPRDGADILVPGTA